jgi:MFS family permease
LVILIRRQEVTVRVIGQIVSVFAVALGVGLLVAGSMIDPVLRADNLDQIVATLERSANEVEFYRNLTAGLIGIGAASLTLGILGLVVPWANVVVYGRRAGALPKSEPAKAV